jgi:CMP-N,N'-diacetyllegionaminic acid synthase
MRIVGVIPARKGSKGIANKNMIDLCGNKLIEYTFKEALKSDLDEVILTTDDDNIINLAKMNYPAISIPFKRPDELSCSDTEAIDVAVHLLEYLKNNSNQLPDAICWLQPTSPLRISSDINDCINLIKDGDVDSVISVVDVHGISPYKMKKINSDGYLENLISLEHKSTNRQKLPKAYIPNGAIFMIRVDILLKHRNFFGKKSLPYEMHEESSVNIDTLLDAKIANLILEKRSSNEI